MVTYEDPNSTFFHGHNETTAIWKNFLWKKPKNWWGNWFTSGRWGGNHITADKKSWDTLARNHTPGSTQWERKSNLEHSEEQRVHTPHHAPQLLWPALQRCGSQTPGFEDQLHSSPWHPQGCENWGWAHKELTCRVTCPRIGCRSSPWKVPIRYVKDSFVNVKALVPGAKSC